MKFNNYLNITTVSARNAAHCIVYDNIEKLHPKFNALVNEANEYIKEQLKLYYGEALYNYVFERIDNFYSYAYTKYYNAETSVPNFYSELKYTNIVNRNKRAYDKKFKYINFGNHIELSGFTSGHFGDTIVFNDDVYKKLDSYTEELDKLKKEVNHIISKIYDKLYKNLKTYERVEFGFPDALPYTSWKVNDDEVIHGERIESISNNCVKPGYIQYDNEYDELNTPSFLLPEIIDFLNSVLPPISKEECEKYKNKVWGLSGYWRDMFKDEFIDTFYHDHIRRHVDISNTKKLSSKILEVIKYNLGDEIYDKLLDLSNIIETADKPYSFILYFKSVTNILYSIDMHSKYLLCKDIKVLTDSLNKCKLLIKTDEEFKEICDLYFNKILLTSYDNYDSYNSYIFEAIVKNMSFSTVYNKIPGLLPFLKYEKASKNKVSIKNVTPVSIEDFTLEKIYENENNEFVNNYNNELKEFNRLIKTIKFPELTSAMECYEYKEDGTTKIMVNTYNNKIIIVSPDEIEVVDDKSDANKMKNWTKISGKTFIDYYNEVVDKIRKHLKVETKK
jgi:hypothetical protein